MLRPRTTNSGRAAAPPHQGVPGQPGQGGGRGRGGPQKFGQRKALSRLFHKPLVKQFQDLMAKKCLSAPTIEEP